MLFALKVQNTKGFLFVTFSFGELFPLLPRYKIRIYLD